jgi:hypothetical protein
MHLTQNRGKKALPSFLLFLIAWVEFVCEEKRKQKKKKKKKSRYRNRSFFLT